jgi:hypothetical protein
MNDGRVTVDEQARRLYEDAEARTGKAMEDLVSRPSLGELLGRITENTVAVTKITSDVGDLVLRNLRLAGRADVIRLAPSDESERGQARAGPAGGRGLRDELRAARAANRAAATVTAAARTRAAKTRASS